MKRNYEEVMYDGLMTGDVSGAIQRQEKRGQGDVNAYDVLPRKMNGATREQFEALGFEFGADVDDLFVQAKLPPGWKKVATDHYLYTNLVDEKGRERASIFYKAAFYDREAFISIKYRYGFSGDHPITGYGAEYKSDADREGAVFDQGVVIWRTERKVEHYSKIGFPTYDASQKELQAETEAYIAARFPDWRNPLAYWD